MFFPQIGQDIEGQFPGDQSGFSISVSDNGNRVAISSPVNDNNTDSGQGRVRVFELKNGTWVQLGINIDNYLKPLDTSQC